MIRRLSGLLDPRLRGDDVDSMEVLAGATWAENMLWMLGTCPSITEERFTPL